MSRLKDHRLFNILVVIFVYIFGCCAVSYMVEHGDLILRKPDVFFAEALSRHRHFLLIVYPNQ
jgi:hypothetical protein